MNSKTQSGNVPVINKERMNIFGENHSRHGWGTSRIARWFASIDEICCIFASVTP